MSREKVVIFSTCPQSRNTPSDEYPAQVADVARWSEAAGCEGILVYTDNGIVDPWLVSQLILQSTERLAPLVAVQPAYMHPYWVAKQVATLAYVHGRRLYLNMLAGGFRTDLLALDDPTPHDERYERTIEYTQIVSALVAGETLTYRGSHYSVSNLSLAPALPENLRPGFLISGSSPAGLDAAQRTGATAVKYPKRTSEEVDQADEGSGIRLGIVARESSEDAWAVARERFPEDRKGQLTQKLAMKVSDSHWHRQLSDMAKQDGGQEEDADPYWLWPFENYATFCPYLVGSYERVVEELRRYVDLGFRCFILDIPPSEEELRHIRVVFDRTRATVS
ncbi:MAG: LLM class flavin-dependent oxidoreductase [Solirubrobacterales bacterium]